MPVDEGGQQQSPQNLEALVAKILKDEESRKAQQEQIDNIQANLRTIGNLICDSEGHCRLATKEDLAKVSEKQGTKTDLNQLSNKELWGRLSKSEVAVQDLKDLHLEKLKKDPTYMLKAAKDPVFRKTFIESVCSDEECRIGLNKDIDEFHKNHKGKGKKESFLIKKK